MQKQNETLRELRRVMIPFYIALTVHLLLGQGSADEYHLGRHQAGSVQIRTTVDDLYRRFGRVNTKLVDLQSEGNFSPWLEIRIPGGPEKESSLTVRIMWWREIGWGVSGISVKDTRFRTREGLGVGSSFGDIEKAYEVRRVSGEGMSGAFVDSLSMTFYFSVNSPPQAISDESLCNDVWIFGVPHRVREARERTRENQKRE